jgi:hypothetical protein
MADRAARDGAWAKMMKDERMKPDPAKTPPFDGKRMFWGGFELVFDTGADAPDFQSRTQNSLNPHPFGLSCQALPSLCTSRKKPRPRRAQADGAGFKGGV